MPPNLTGETAAILPALMWTTCSILFASAGKRIGALSVNSIRTLMALAPFMIIPLVWIFYKKKTNWRGIIGAVVAVVGVAILFLK